MKLNSFTTSLKLTLRGKWMMKFFTILLSAFGFTLFALASAGFTFDKSDFVFRAYRNYLQNHSYLFFGNDSSTDGLSQDDVAFITENTSLNLISACIGGAHIDRYVRSYFYDGEKIGNYTQSEEYLKFEEEKREHYLFSATCVLIGEEKALKENGVALLAGKYPEAENEIALGKEYYDLFVWGGYCDNFDHFRERTVERMGKDGPVTLIEYYYDNETPPNEREEITSYSDLIGKTLSAEELAETGGYASERIPKQVVITGIVDTSGVGEWDYPYRSDRGFFTNVILRSEAWRQKQIAAGKLQTEAMLAPSPLTDGQIKEVMNVTEELSARAAEKNGVQYYHYYEGIFHDYKFPELPRIGAYGYDILISPGSSVDVEETALLLCLMGIVFLIFSVALNVSLMTAMLRMKQKQIGILRSLGAPSRKVSSYFFIGTLLLATIIFITALTMSLILYYCWMSPAFTYANYGVCYFVYNGWTALILAGICFTVPVLSVLLPLNLFMRRSCVEMMKDTKQKGKEK